MNPKKWPWILAAVAIGTGVATLVTYEDSNPIYLTASVERGDITQVITATGTLRPVVTVDVGSQISGQIREVIADFNDAVDKDEPIARLDATIFEASAREAEAALEVARASVDISKAALEKASAQYDNARFQEQAAVEQIAGLGATLEEARQELARVAQLRKKGTVSQREVGRAQAANASATAEYRAAKARLQVEEANVQAAEAELGMARAELRNQRGFVRQKQAALEKARIELSRTTIRAPIEGVIISRDVEPGQTVAASLEAPTLFQIAGDLSEMMVYAQIDEADIGQIKLGQPAQFTVDAYPKRKFEGSVVQIRKAPEEVQNVVTYTILLLAKNPGRLLLPGMTAIVRVITARAENVLKIPSAALRFRPPPEFVNAYPAMHQNPPAVWLLRNEGIPEPVAIEPGLSDDMNTAVASDALFEGQQVIVGAGRGRRDQSARGFGVGL